ncbi:MAG: DNA repair protein RecN [Clostridia bacterium]|nr:DNA repair protein RecN [Clostridia bacterium]
MLSNIIIENIAIIEYASIDFKNNFNCMTGETGAGKSIIIDSINAVIGEKTSRELIRTGESKATVTAFFTDISEKSKTVLSEMGIPCESDNTLHITRTLYKDGRNSCKINGNNVTVSMLKNIGLSLLNIHGQSDNQQLMAPELHYTFIDSVADNSELFNIYSDNFNELQSIKNQINKLTLDEAFKARRIDLLEYQIDEIKKADIRIGEKDELITRKTAMNNSQKIVSSLNDAYCVLNGSDDFSGAVSLLFDAARALNAVSAYLPDAGTMAETLNDMAYTSEAYSSDISNMIDNSQFDERELADIEERLDVIYRLSKKYGETEEEILDFLDKAEKELHNITYSDELIQKLNAQLIKQDNITREAALKLSDSRKKAASFFEKRIREELSFLDMPDTVFFADFKETDFSDTGIDNIEFLISANKGEEAKPLSKIASGGELSRIMLAIKSVLSDKDETDTLIFDEIDTGVSGRAATKIAKKLYDVSKNRQVLCITHLASIAAYADNHMLISKAVRDEKTYTSVTPLDTDGRVAEISRIIGGDESDKIHLESAKQLLNEASAYK